jgi:hypothetical protein
MAHCFKTCTCPKVLVAIYLRQFESLTFNFAEGAFIVQSAGFEFIKGRS